MSPLAITKHYSQKSLNIKLLRECFSPGSWCVITTTFCPRKRCQNFWSIEFLLFFFILLNGRCAYSNLVLEFYVHLCDTVPSPLFNHISYGCSYLNFAEMTSFSWQDNLSLIWLWFLAFNYKGKWLKFYMFKLNTL